MEKEQLVEPLIEFSARYTLFLVLNGYSIDYSDKQASLTLEMALDNISENFGLTEPQLEEIDKIIEERYNERIIEICNQINGDES